MRKLKRIFTWYLLLQKRLLKKPLFLILLVLIPVLCLFYSDAAREESGKSLDELFREVFKCLPNF